MTRNLALWAVLALPLCSIAADNPDESFFENAAQAGLAEVAAGKLAQSKGSSKSVKDFGAMMVKDHTAANMKLKAIADAKSVKLPTEPGLIHKGKAELLEHKDGKDFDEAYIDGQIKDHEDTVKLLQKEIASGSDAEAMTFAKETLPKVQSHLTAVKEIKAGRHSSMQH